MLADPRGHPLLVSESARAAALAALNGEQSFTGSGALDQFLKQMDPQYRKPADGWGLEGRASTREFTAHWQGAGQDGRALATVLLRVELTTSPSRYGIVMIRFDTQLTNPGRPRPPDPSPHLHEVLRPPGAGHYEIIQALIADDDLWESTGLPRPLPQYDHFVTFDALGSLMLSILGTLWGPLGETLSGKILGQMVGPPAHLDLTVFATQFSSNPVTPQLDSCIDFGDARLISGNVPGTWTRLGPIQPDRTFLSQARQEQVVREWLIHLGVDNGYENVEQEVNRHRPQS